MLSCSLLLTCDLSKMPLILPYHIPREEIRYKDGAKGLLMGKVPSSNVLVAFQKETSI